MRRETGFTLIELLIVVAIIGIIAAIAIPSLLRARVSANEAAAIGDTRSVLSAESAYHAANSGFYGSITCLATPSSCISQYPATAPTFLDGSIAGANPVTKLGYVRSFLETPASGGGAGPGSADAYCYQSVPATPNKTGVRGFGGDSSGLVQNNSGAACCTALGVDTAACLALR